MNEFLHDNDEILMKYLDGEMNPEEKTVFEKQLENDAALKERLQNLQLAIAAVSQYGTAEMVKSVHSEMVRELSPVKKDARIVPFRNTIRVGLAIAASIIIVLVGVNIFSSSGLSSEQLYKEGFVDYDVSAVRGNASGTQVVKLYREHNYRAITETAASLDLMPADSLLVGISYLKMNQPGPAIQWLNSISVQNGTRQDAEFYLSLAYLHNKNYNEAIHLMQRIHSDPDHAYNKQLSEEYINKVKKISAE